MEAVRTHGGTPGGGFGRGGLGCDRGRRAKGRTTLRRGDPRGAPIVGAIARRRRPSRGGAARAVDLGVGGRDRGCDTTGAGAKSWVRRRGPGGGGGEVSGRHGGRGRWVRRRPRAGAVDLVPGGGWIAPTIMRPRGGARRARPGRGEASRTVPGMVGGCVAGRVALERPRRIPHPGALVIREHQLPGAGL